MNEAYCTAHKNEVTIEIFNSYKYYNFSDINTLYINALYNVHIIYHNAVITIIHQFSQCF